MMGKFLASFIVVCGVLAGGGMYYLQVYAFYDAVVPNGSSDVVLTKKLDSIAEPIAYTNFQAIDSKSSPIRYRACFQSSQSPVELGSVYKTIDDAVPLNAPSWFKCFKAKELGSKIEAGEAVSFLAIENIVYGIDRVVTILPNRLGYSWNRINNCGKRAFDGKPLLPGCPLPPESL